MSFLCKLFPFILLAVCEGNIMFADNNGTFEFKCPLNSLSCDEMAWFKDSESIPLIKGKYSISCDPINSILTINNSSFSDEGYYNCTNGGPNAPLLLSLPPEKIGNTNYNITVLVGSYTTVDCSYQVGPKFSGKFKLMWENSSGKHVIDATTFKDVSDRKVPQFNLTYEELLDMNSIRCVIDYSNSNSVPHLEGKHFDPVYYQVFLQPKLTISANSTLINESDAVSINCTATHPRLEYLRLEGESRPNQNQMFNARIERLNETKTFTCIAEGDGINSTETITIDVIPSPSQSYAPTTSHSSLPSLTSTSPSSISVSPSSSPVTETSPPVTETSPPMTETSPPPQMTENLTTIIQSSACGGLLIVIVLLVIVIAVVACKFIRRRKDVVHMAETGNNSHQTSGSSIQNSLPVIQSTSDVISLDMRTNLSEDASTMARSYCYECASRIERESRCSNCRCQSSCPPPPPPPPCHYTNHCHTHLPQCPSRSHCRHDYPGSCRQKDIHSTRSIDTGFSSRHSCSCTSQLLPNQCQVSSCHCRETSFTINPQQTYYNKNANNNTSRTIQEQFV